jgi:hypothetical protein
MHLVTVWRQFRTNSHSRLLHRKPHIPNFASTMHLRNNKRKATWHMAGQSVQPVSIRAMPLESAGSSGSSGWIESAVGSDQSWPERPSVASGHEPAGYDNGHSASELLWGSSEVGNGGLRAFDCDGHLGYNRVFAFKSLSHREIAR